MAGLLGGVLPAIYSGADQLKRQIYGLLTNPNEMAQRAGQNLLQTHAENQALMSKAHGNPQNPLQITDPTAFSELTNRYMAGVTGVAPIGMIAYHGTPHTIQGKFDISKVGTGEGAQSYGHGMYFAEARPVAEQYQAALSNTKYLSGNKELKGNDAWAASFLYDFQGNALPKKVDVKTAVAKANEILKSGEAREEIVSKIKQLDKAGVAVESGNLYKVDIPDEHIPMMLDWDKPFAQQPKYVQDAIKNSEWDAKGIVGYWMDKSKENSSYTGSDLYQRLTSTLGSDKAASDYLNSIGIKGINYLDQGSRISQKYTGDPAFISAAKSFKESNYSLEDAFKGMKQAYKNEDIQQLKDAIGQVYGTKPNLTSNFVVFDPTDVKILERNDKPIESLLGN